MKNELVDGLMSIRTRLNLWYTCLLAAALLVFGALLYSFLSTALTLLVDDRLATEAHGVTSAIESQQDPQDALLSGRVPLTSTDVFASQYYIQLVNLQGAPLQASQNLQARRLAVPAEVRGDIVAGRSRAFTLDLGGSDDLRVRSEPIILQREPAGAVLVGESLGMVEETLELIRRLMLWMGLAWLLLAALGGMIFSRAALRPLQTISDTARRITLAEDLGRRIPVAVPHDELGQLTGTINAMLARLEAVFQTQQRLVADVSHELRTPLTTIRGNLELLHRDAVNETAPRAEAWQAIEDETNRMHRLINDLLLLAQADAGLKLGMQPVELDTLLLEVYRQARVMARERVAVRLGAEDQALVLGDPDRLRQLLLNLVHNSLKYTPPGGQVTLELQKSEGWVQIAVTDTGSGISPSDLSHIFERFYRADRSRARPGGAGLGLSIAHWIAQAHNGRLEAESDLGVGSTFRLWLPLEVEPLATGSGRGTADGPIHKEPVGIR